MLQMKSPVTGSGSIASLMAIAEPNAVPEGRHVWVVLGPAGSGKSTVCQRLANTLGGSYIEGDDYHSPANVAKMASGHPLTDQDRQDWLWSLEEACINEPCPSGPVACNVFLSCSALRREYRDTLRQANRDQLELKVKVHFLYLHVPIDLAQERVAARKGHYMGAQMVQSQYDTLQEPASDEMDVIWLDASTSTDKVVVSALQRMGTVLASERT